MGDTVTSSDPLVGAPPLMCRSLKNIGIDPINDGVPYVAPLWLEGKG